jgi:hypothetical protein
MQAICAVAIAYSTYAFDRDEQLGVFPAILTLETSDGLQGD